MSEAANPDADSHAPATRGGNRQYVVVARRYRPQTFDELVGQQHISQALAQAIATNRVGHAYLFTGARGVGKTSAARIFAKALNCVNGPTSTPCNQCESCLAITSGEDVDVLEIDGASNRGIDEIRQMRANVNIRPSRSRMKIYIIDEVHMLTLPAFNALLKTLEEPPEHVKFIFCTTDPNKLPITVLSRCQRFDFAGIQTDSIFQRLRQIVDAEGAQADDDALRLLARRAAGSMRDSQSLLEQLLAFGGEKVTEDDVHSMLGTAGGGQLSELAASLVQRDAATALGRFDEALRGGVDAGQLVEQLLGYFRDMMTVLVGCQADMLLYCTSDDHDELQAAGQQMGLTTVLAVQQILDQALTRIRQSVHVRTLAELSIVRICQLEDLDDLGQWISQLKEGSPAGASPAAGNPSPKLMPRVHREVARPAPAPQTADTTREKAGERGVDTPPKKIPPAPADHQTAPSEPVAAPIKETTAPSPPASEQTATTSVQPLSEKNARKIWDETLAAMGDMTAECASRYSRLAISAPNTLEITFSAKYTSSKAFCDRPERRQQLEAALLNATGSPMRIVFQVDQADTPSVERPKARQSHRELIREASSNPLVQQALELFDAHVTRVDPPRDQPSGSD